MFSGVWTMLHHSFINTIKLQIFINGFVPISNICALSYPKNFHLLLIVSLLFFMFCLMVKCFKHAFIFSAGVDLGMAAFNENRLILLTGHVSSDLCRPVALGAFCSMLKKIFCKPMYVLSYKMTLYWCNICPRADGLAIHTGNSCSTTFIKDRRYSRSSQG